MPQFTVTQDKTYIEFQLEGNIYIGNRKEEKRRKKGSLQEAAWAVRER